MFAPTASQMLRDDQRLRNLHRETLKRRKRFQAKQKQLEDAEQHRRINALRRRRQQRDRHLSAFRKNHHPNDNYNPSLNPSPPNRQRRHSNPPQVPIRVHHKRTRDRSKSQAILANKNNDELPRSVVPPLNLSSIPQKYQGNKRYQPAKKIENDNFSNHEKKTDFEFNDNDEVFPAVSDQMSVAELDDFDKKHFGMEQSIDVKQHNSYEQNHKIKTTHIPHNNHNLDINPSKSGNGYQQLFHQKIVYENQQNMNDVHSNKYMAPSNYAPNHHKQSIDITKSINGSLYNMDDVDMKEPEDNDSVKINPNDSMDCSKMNFSTVYNSNLLPLQSVLNNDKHNTRNKQNHSKPKILSTNKSIISNKSNQYQYQHLKRIQLQRQNMMRNYLYPTPPKSKQSQRSLGHSQASSIRGTTSRSYGIKLPRLTQSILQEKDRLDSKRQHSPKSTISAPVWNRIGNKGNMSQNPKRKSTTISDDFFTKMSDFALDSPRKSNNTMFLPKINRSRLKPTKPRYSKFNKQNTAYSVISEYDIIKEEDKLKKSLMRINETLSNLEMEDRTLQRTIVPATNVNKRYPNYMRDTKVSSIPRKIKTKKSPTFKTRRQRRRWNI